MSDESDLLQNLAPRRGLAKRRLMALLAILAIIGVGTVVVYRNWSVPALPPAAAQLAADFSLPDAQAREGQPPVTLSALLKHGPVVIVFHRGLHCPYCVLQLGQMAGKMDEFRKAGVQFVAIGPDALETARDTLLSYPELAGQFPVLCDPENKVASAYGLEIPDGFLHGAFVIDRDHHIQLAKRSEEPASDPTEMLSVALAAQGRR